MIVLENRYVDQLGKSGHVLVARIKPQSDLLQSIHSIVEENELKAGVILSGVGLLCKASLRNCKILPKEYPITDMNRSYLSFEKPMEILSLSGNITEVDGQPLVHAHIMLSFVENDEIKVVGGHLIEGAIIFGFAEIILMELKDIKMNKQFDEETKTRQLFI